MSTALIRKARRQALEAICELKHMDRQLTRLGCLDAHVHFKRRLNGQGELIVTSMMYLLEPQDPVSRKRRYTYVGVNRARQDEALARIERFKLRERLRVRIIRLKQSFRCAEHELTTALAIYRDLTVQARDCAREFALLAWETS